MKKKLGNKIDGITSYFFFNYLFILGIYNEIYTNIQLSKYNTIIGIIF